MRHADYVARGFGQHGDIDGVLGHQIGDELVAEFGVEFIGILEGHPEKAPRNPVPERRSTGLVDDAAQFGNAAVGKARAVRGDEQVAAARDQHAQPAGALARMEEQPADFGRALKIGRQVEDIGAESAAQLLAVLRQGADPV